MENATAEQIEETLTTLQGATSKENLTENETQNSIQLLHGCNEAVGKAHAEVANLPSIYFTFI